jgi:hypothetical protein
MPHITTYTGLIARNQASQPTDDYIKLGDIKAGFQVTEFSGDVVTGQANSDDSLAYAGSLFGEGVFKPQSIEDKGSVIFGDNHFRTGGGDSLTGEGRSTKIWTTGGPSTFEDRQVGDYDANDAVFGVRENIGSTYGPGGTTFMTETFEPAAGMDSFGESLNLAFEVGGTSGPGGTSFMTGNIGFPTNNLTGSAGPGGDDI